MQRDLKILQRISWIEQAMNDIVPNYQSIFGESKDIAEIYECIGEIKKLLKE